MTTGYRSNPPITLRACGGFCWSRVLTVARFCFGVAALCLGQTTPNFGLCTQNIAEAVTKYSSITVLGQSSSYIFGSAF